MKIKEIEEQLAKSKTYELNPNARYLVVTENIPVEHCYEIQQWMKNQGVDAVVLPVPCKLFEIEREGQ